MPLVWMVREARKAGLRFDEEKMIEMKCWDETDPDINDNDFALANESLAPEVDVPQLTVSVAESPSASKPTAGSPFSPGRQKKQQQRTSKFHDMLMEMGSKSVKHDTLEFGGGLKASQVLAWGFMEYLPFRRMDLMFVLPFRPSSRYPPPPIYTLYLQSLFPACH